MNGQAAGVLVLLGIGVVGMAYLLFRQRDEVLSRYKDDAEIKKYLEWKKKNRIIRVKITGLLI